MSMKETDKNIPVNPEHASPESYKPKKPAIINLAEANSESISSKKFKENVLDGVEYMSYGNPSAVCYIGSVMRLMEYIGDPIEADELFSLSGTALCFPWKFASCCDEVSIIQEIPKRTFSALGYECEYIYEPDITGQPRVYSKEFYVNKIKASIDKGRPVIGFGLTQDNFTCLITGYYNNGNGLYLRSYWSPEGLLEGYDGVKNYFFTEDWYDKCYGIAVIGDKVSDRLKGAEAYKYIIETAEMMRGIDSVSAMGDMISTGMAAFDSMTEWLMKDENWINMNSHEQFLKQCGLLLLNHYRSYLHGYLGRMNTECPNVVNTEIFKAIEKMGENMKGANCSDLYLNENVDSEITDFSMMKDRSVREKVADYVQRLKKYDADVFDCLIHK